MSHTVKTTVITSATGQISGYGFCVEAEHDGGADEIRAAIIASLDMLRQTITASFAGLPTAAHIAASFDPPPPEPNPMGSSEGDEPPARASTPATPAGPPATPEEAERRFYTRYGEIIGGGNWADVQRYLRRPRAVEPKSVEQWIAAAEAVRDRSRAHTTPEQPARWQYARH